MAIVGQNALLNQYMPTFYIKDIRDGQTLRYDSVRKAFVNAEGSGGTGATRLGELLDVSPTVDNPLSLEPGQALVYDPISGLWTNKFVDYNTLLNKPVIPTNSSFSFAGLSDTAKPALPNGYVKWNSDGTQLIYSTTIPAESITGLAQVATTGDYNDLTNLPPASSWKQYAQLISDTDVPLSGSLPLFIDGVEVSSGDKIVLAAQSNPSENGVYVLIENAGTYTLERNIDADTPEELNGAVIFIQSGDIYRSTIWAQTGVVGVDFSNQQWQQSLGGGVYTAGSAISINSSDQISITVDDITAYVDSNNNLAVKSSAIAGQILKSAGSESAQWGSLDISNSSSVTGVLPIASGGTGATTAQEAFNALVPNQAGNAGKVLSTNGTTTSWITVSGTGSVTSVSATGSQGVTTLVLNSTTTPEIQIGLGNITPTSVAATGTVTGSNLSGTNTGDQTITLTGDVTGSGTGTFPTTLATVNSAPQTNTFRKITVNGKGLVTATSAVSSTDITNALGFTPYDATNPNGYTSNTGTVTNVSVTTANGVSGVVANPTTTPAITLSLGAITPTSVAATGNVTGANLSGTNTGDQTITLTGDVTGSGTGSFPATLATVNASPQTNTFRKITVNGKGLVTATSAVVSTDIISALGFTPYDASNPNGYTNNTGTVTSINASGGTTGLSFAGGPITSSGTLTLGGTLAIANGGTGQTTAAAAINALLPSQTGNSGMFLTTNGTVASWAPNPTGSVTTVSVVTANGVSGSVANPTTTPAITLTLGAITPTSVAATGNVTGANLSGTNTGDQTITLTGDVTGSGTGSFPATLAIVNLAPQTDAFRKITVNGKGLVTATSAVSSTDITNALGFTPYDATNPNGYTSNTGTVTSVGASGGTTGLTFTGSPITTTGVLTLSGTLSISNGGTGATTAADAINALVPNQATKNGMFLTTDGSVVSWAPIPSGTGSVTAVSGSGLNGVIVTVTNPTTTPNVEIDLGNITPTSVAATGTVTGSNLSGTNTGDQTIELTGDVTGSGTGTFTATLATVNTTPGTYGDSHFVPTINVNGKGLVTSITVQHVDTTVRDLVEEVDTIVVAPRHQYIVTGTMEVLGRMENNGRIAIL